jgi:hypothetical protein
MCDPLHRVPPELRERLVHVTYAGRTYGFDTHPGASAEDDLRQVMDSFRQSFPDLDQGNADRAAEIFRKQIEEIKGREKP